MTQQLDLHRAGTGSVLILLYQEVLIWHRPSLPRIQDLVSVGSVKSLSDKSV